MVKIILIAATIILIAIVIIYSWYNRDSDRVVFTLITAMTIGAVGFITKESISNKLETFSSEFPVVAFYGLPNYRPLNITLPYSSDLTMATQNIKPSDIPENDTDMVDINYAQNIYFDAIQYSVITTIFSNYTHGWNVKAKRMRTPNGETLTWENSNDSGDNITINDFVNTHIPNNYFFNLGIHDNLPKPFGGKVVFPPNTTINVVASKENRYFLLSLKTKYISMDIKLSPHSSSVGIGEYAKIFGLPSVIEVGVDSENNKYGHAVFKIEVSINQTYLLNGHPDMKKHRNWANSITALLETTFSYDLIREEHMKQIQIYGSEAIQRI